MKFFSRLTFIVIAVLFINTMMYAQGVLKKTEKRYYYSDSRNNKLLKRKHLSGISYFLYDDKGKLLEVTTEGAKWAYGYTDSTMNTIDSTSISHTNHSKDYYTKRTYFYNKNDRLEKTESWQHAKKSPEKFLIFKELYEYDSVGTLKQKVRLFSNGWVWNTWRYLDYKEYSKYSDLSNFINTIETSSDPSDRSGLYIINDSLGRPLIFLDFFDETIVSIERHVYEFDSEVEYYFRGNNEDVNNLDRIVEVRYDYDSKINKLITHSINNILGIDEYIYNRKGNLIKVLHYENTKLTGYTKYYYQ